MNKVKPSDKSALVKTINGEFLITYTNSRDFINSMRTSIERGVLYEFTEGNTRSLINCKNIVSIEMTAEALPAISPFIAPVKTPEMIREEQIAMQPGIVALEAKAKFMNNLKAEQDATRQGQLNQIYDKK